MASPKPFVFVLALCLAATTVAAQDVTVAVEDDSVDVAPGSHADVTLVFTNSGSTTSAEKLLVMPVHGEPYTFEQESPGCGAIVPYLGGMWRQFSVDPIPAGGTRTCIVRVDRPADALDNMFADWFVEDSNWLSFFIGTFTDLDVTMTRVGPAVVSGGMARATYRLDTRNLGAVGFTNALVSLGEYCMATGTVVDMNFPGGCSFTEVACPWEGSGPGTLVSLAPGESSSCLVRYSTPTEFDTHVSGGLVAGMFDSITGGWMSDDNADNNAFRIDIAEGAAPPSEAPALSSWSMLVLALTLAAIAFGARRRAR
jgi:hypothetical protein